MAFSLNRHYRHIGRYRRIGEVLLRHGFGYLLQQLDLTHILPPLRRIQSLRANEKPILIGARFKKVLEELGPTFVKFGQILSTRADVIPGDIIKELEELQDEVAPIPFDSIRNQVEEELGEPIDDLFSSFNSEPVAAASIGQVHYAVLKDGKEVVVKVQRPGIRKTITTDLEILFVFARALQERLRKELVDPVEIVERFSRTIKKELDYVREGRNIERFNVNFKDYSDIIIPNIHWGFSTDKVLTMDYIRGEKLKDVIAANKNEYDVQHIADIAAQSFMKQIFTDGFFHGDPHPGNILICEGNKLAFLDFGIVGRVDRSTMQGLARLLVAITNRDIDALMDVLFELEAFIGKPTRELKMDLADLIDVHYGKTLQELNFSAVLEDLLDLIRRHPLRLPTELLLLAKSLVTVEGVGARLVPDFNVMEIAEPFAREWIAQHYNFSSMFQRGQKQTTDMLKSLSSIPGFLEETFRQATDGELEIHFRHEGLDKLINRLDFISNRITFGLIVSALIVGSSLLILFDQGPSFMQIPIIGLFGFVLAGLSGIWLLIAIFRSGRF